MHRGQHLTSPLCAPFSCQTFCQVSNRLDKTVLVDSGSSDLGGGMFNYLVEWYHNGHLVLNTVFALQPLWRHNKCSNIVNDILVESQGPRLYNDTKHCLLSQMPRTQQCVKARCTTPNPRFPSPMDLPAFWGILAKSIGTFLRHQTWCGLKSPGM